MIKKVSAGEKNKLLTELKKYPVQNIYGVSFIEGFPYSDKFYKAYLIDSGCLVTMGNTAHIYGKGDIYELREFLCLSGIQTVYDYGENGFDEIDRRAEIFALHTCDKLKDSEIVCSSEVSDEEKIYELWKNYFPFTPDKDTFFVTSVEQRCYLHGRRCIITDNGRIVSSASVLMENENTALLGGIVTDGEYRNRGYAGETVSFLTKEVLSEGKMPVIFTVDETAKRLYERLGFELCGYVDIIEMRGI